MRINFIAFLLFSQFLIACQQGPEHSLPWSAETGHQAIKVSQQIPVNTPPSAANIVFQSVDGGQTWQDVSNGLPTDLDVRCIFTNGDQVILGTEDGLYRSSARSQVSMWEKDPFLTDRITAISPGSKGPYFSSYDIGFFKEMPGMGILTPLHNTLKEKKIHSVLEAPGGALFVGSDSGIFKSTDEGRTWKHVFNGGMVLDIVASDGVLIGGGRQGVLRSTDGGEHWNLVLNEQILAKKTGLIGDRFVTILGTNDPSEINPDGITSRLRVSPDGGKTWQRMEQSLLPVQGMYDMDERLSQTRDIYDIVQIGGYLLCSFDTGIYRSADQGKTWELVLPSTKERVLSNITVSGNVIYALKGGGC